MNGVKITKAVDIKSATDNDFVLNTDFLGGMKISEIKIFTPGVDGVTASTADFIRITYAHGLNYVPATVCFQGGIQGIGWQNSALIGQPSVNADNNNIYIVCSTSIPLTPIYAIIFAEPVAD
jgi:hypothetical protein